MGHLHFYKMEGFQNLNTNKPLVYITYFFTILFVLVLTIPSTLASLGEIFNKTDFIIFSFTMLFFCWILWGLNNILEEFIVDNRSLINTNFKIFIHIFRILSLAFIVFMVFLYLILRKTGLT